MDEAQPEKYDVVVVGGGPAGLSAALYCTRLGHLTALVDRGGGRAAMMQDVHNVIGVPESLSGNEYLEIGREQLESYGCDLVRDKISAAHQLDDGTFELSGTNSTFQTKYIVLATGFTDKRPDPPLPRTSRGLHYCLHCDAYMFVNKSVYVMGHSTSAVHVAAIMLNFTDEVDLLTRGADPEWNDDTERLLEAHPIDVITDEITGIQNGEDGWLEAIEFEDGTIREYRGGFAMYGSTYHNELARELGCTINEDGTVSVDDHGRTSVDTVYAVGDLTPGHKQVPIAIAEGAKAGISIHFDLRSFPLRSVQLEEGAVVDSEDVPGIPTELLERAVAHHMHG